MTGQASRADADGADWAEKIGKSAAGVIAEMVAALECDYDRLRELRDERDGFEFDPDADAREAWAGENPEDAEELAELEAAAGDCSDRDEAEQRIQKDALSVEVRSDWHAPGDRDADSKPAKFRILIRTGGPATMIEGDLDEQGQPVRARLMVQDWFKPWTEYVPADGETLLTYARCFFFGE